MNKDLRETFEERCRLHFAFLSSDFGFRIDSVRKDVFGCFITYINKFAEVKFDFCPLDAWIKVTIFQVIDGQICKPTIFFDPNQELHSFEFDVLTLIRTNKIVTQKEDDLYNVDEIERILSEYAGLMKQCATDVLQGDFKVLPEIKSAIIRKCHN